MRIAFLTGCLEPGKDGVGDYTRLLAQECVRQGHAGCLLALRDRYANKQPEAHHPKTHQPEATNDGEVPCLRLPTSLSWRSVSTLAGEYLDRFQPDWLSVQFVSYGYHPKGLPWNLVPLLQQLSSGRKVHLMFHELWIGDYAGAPWKERAIGLLQQFLIRYLVQSLRPQVIQTSNPTYIAQLQQLGIAATWLPMFGAIPIGNENADRWLFPLLQDAGIADVEAMRARLWLFGFFGNLSPLWQPEPLFTYLAEAARQHQRQIVLLSIGRLGDGQALWDRIAARYQDRFPFFQLGPRSPDSISAYFHSLDWGITATPYELLGKSASAAAMLEHGLPVIVNMQFDEISPELERTTQAAARHLVVRGTDPAMPNLLGTLRRLPPQSRLPEVAAGFLDGLEIKSQPFAERDGKHPSQQTVDSLNGECNALSRLR